MTWPSDAAAPGGDFNTTAPSPLGDQPKFFDQLPYTGSGQGSGYNPLYPFAYGLSYTTFNVTGLSATQSVSRTGTVTTAFTVANTGSVAGTDVVPVYVHQPVSAVVVPPQRLVGFARVTLTPGQTKTVHVAFPASALAVTPGDISGAAPRRWSSVPTRRRSAPRPPSARTSPSTADTEERILTEADTPAGPVRPSWAAGLPAGVPFVMPGYPYRP